MYIVDDEQRRDRRQHPCALRVPAPRGHLQRQRVGAPRRCTSTSPASRRLASAPVALGTPPLPILGRAPKRATEGPADEKNGDSHQLKGQASDNPA